jgi:hypothetical protein
MATAEGILMGAPTAASADEPATPDIAAEVPASLPNLFMICGVTGDFKDDINGTFTKSEEIVNGE